MLNTIRTLKVTFNKSGSGSDSCSTRLPVKILEDMGISRVEREIILKYDEKKKEILIKKST